MPIPNRPTVSVIIPVHNGGAKFRRCLLSLAASDPPPEEIIVVADGDTDGSWRMAEEFGAHVLRISVPGGPARARNLGASKAHGDILFFVDADITIPSDAVRQITAPFQSNPGLAAVIGSYDDEPLENNFLSQYKNLFHHYVHQTAKDEASTFWGACGAIRSEVFSAIGGYDEVYRRPSIEDVELGYRLKKGGYRIRLLKELQVKHLKHWGIFSLLKTDFFYRALPWTGLILRDAKFIDDLNIKVSNRISVVFVYMLLLTFLGALGFPQVSVISVFLVMAILGLNRNLYGFFWDKRGFSFALKTIPWHWFYFFYCGLAFSMGYASYQVKRTLRRRRGKQKRA